VASAVNEGRQASNAHPQAFSVGAAGNEHGLGFWIPATEAFERRRLISFSLRLFFLHYFEREGFGFTFFNRQRAFGADAKTKTGAVAKGFADQTSFAIDYLDCALRARNDAGAAAGAFFFIDSHYFSSGGRHTDSPSFQRKHNRSGVAKL
jgi:hypothetical protein